MQDLNDQSLVLRCINGDRLAWNGFVERFSRLVLWAIREKLKYTNFHYAQQDVEDIFQNVFCLLWEKGKLQQIRNREKVSGWLAMVAANCALNYFRNKKEEVGREELLLEKAQSGDCTVADTFDEVCNLLSPRERIILKLNYLYDKTHQEIGQILKMPTNTVSSLIKRTKERLKEKLEKEGYKFF